MWTKRLSGRSWVIPCLGLASWLGYLHLGLLRNWGGRDDVVYFLGCMTALFALYAAALGYWRMDSGARHRLSGRRLLIAAFLFRLALIPAGAPGGWADLVDDFRNDDELVYQSFLIYDNDVWRYLWDGHAMTSGVNTYRHSPGDIEAAYEEDLLPLGTLLEPALWQEVHERVSYPEYRTIYPPLAQGAFALVTLIAPASVATWKMLLLIFDMGTCWLLISILRRRGQPIWFAAIYGWNPLAIKEIVGSGHVDGLMIFFLVLTWWAMERQRQRLALAALAAAILIKLTPLLLVPLLLRHIDRRHWWILPSIGMAAYAPWVSSLPIMIDSLKAFSSQWVFNPGPWAAVRRLTHWAGFEGRALADAISLTATLITVAVATWRCPPTWQGLLTGSRWILAIYLLMSPTVMPWYLLWALPLWVMRPGVTWPTLTWLSLLSYLVYIDGVEHSHWLNVEFTLFFAVVLWSYGHRRQRNLELASAPPDTN